MKKVLMFRLNKNNDYATIEIPKGSEILSVQCQDFADITLWALVETDISLETRIFKISRTGNYIGESLDNLSYIGTVQTHKGEYVWHVFEIEEGEESA